MRKVSNLNPPGKLNGWTTLNSKNITMAGVINNTARQFNIKVIYKGSRIKVLLAPGFNDVQDDIWKPCSQSEYCKRLKAENKIDFGPKIDAQTLDDIPIVKSKAKKEPLPKKVTAPKVDD